jgi:hypothetical protein
VEAEADAGHERGQVRELPPVEGQVLDLGTRDELTDAGLLDVDQRRFRDDRDLLGLGRHRHLELDAGGGGDVDRDALRRLGREAREVRLHLVTPDGQPVDGVHARGVGLRGALEARVLVRGRDRHARERESLFVRHLPVNVPLLLWAKPGAVANATTRRATPNLANRLIKRPPYNFSWGCSPRFFPGSHADVKWTRRRSGELLGA